MINTQSTGRFRFNFGDVADWFGGEYHSMGGSAHKVNI
jgi:hypothetical protein